MQDLSYWDPIAGAAADYEPLAGPVSADVAIVGGGYAGLSAALHLAEQGARVVVLEAEQPGWGASGRNGGQVIPGVKHDPSELAAMLGAGPAEALTEFVGGTADATFALIARLGLKCGAERCGWLNALHSPEAAARAERRARDWQRVGAPVELLDAAQTARALGSARYVGGFLDRRGGRLHPLAFARQLARAAHAAGALIFGSSRVVALERQAGTWAAATADGAAHAAQVIVATNAYAGPLVPRLSRSYVPIQSVQIATAPLSENVAGSVIPSGHVVSDTRRLVLYARREPDGRLLLGGRGAIAATEVTAARHVAFLRAAAGRLFPQIGLPEIAYAWSGQVNGRGVALSIAAGQALARLLGAGQPMESFPLHAPGPSAIPLHRLRLPAIAAATGWFRFRDWLDGRRDSRPHEAST
jgi:glycine/D-amino acid oxidase-like deaminating enzyme